MGIKSAIFDLDGTLCDCRHRLSHVSGNKKNWDSFFEGIPDDPVVEPVLDVLRALIRDDVAIVLTTGRPEKTRFDTETWLDEHNVPYDKLYMRPDNDTRTDNVVKAQLYEGIKKDGYEVFLAVDDRQSIVDLWRSLGICTLQCAPTDDIGPSKGTLTLMVGPAGSGKSTWLASNVPPSMIVSSDTIRQQLCGDFRDQSKNDEVFAAVHALVATRLKHGLDVYLDATNLRRKNRLDAVALANGGAVFYLVMNRPMEDKRRDGGWRNEVDGLLEKHENTFNSQLSDILAGDKLPNVTVVDLRS